MIWRGLSMPLPTLCAKNKYRSPPFDFGLTTSSTWTGLLCLTRACVMKY
jgi:hypothetical protein